MRSHLKSPVCSKLTMFWWSSRQNWYCKSWGITPNNFKGKSMVFAEFPFEPYCDTKMYRHHKRDLKNNFYFSKISLWIMKIVFSQVFVLLLMATVDKYCITINLFDFEVKFWNTVSQIFRWRRNVRLQRNDSPISWSVIFFIKIWIVDIYDIYLLIFVFLFLIWRHISSEVFLSSPVEKVTAP